MSEGDLIYCSRRTVKAGELQRYVITFEPKEELKNRNVDSLWLKVRNTESVATRAAFLRGPYILYTDVTPGEYDKNKPTFVTLDQPKFEPNLSPSQKFICELSLHTIKDKYVWTVDVVSQIIFSSTSEVAFEVLIGLNKECLNLSTDKLGSFDPRLTVNRQDTMDLWNLPHHSRGKPVHLVILTHGLHSNTGADLFYIKEQIDKVEHGDDEELLVRGFHGNNCKTELGVKYLGSKVGEYIIQQLYNEDVKKISFIGHSLGGLVQTFAIAYIQVNFPWFFQKVKPINFITMATPLLGIVTDNPAYIKAALSFGVVGKTGQDLGLECVGNEEPLLKLLPLGPTHKVLRAFQNRTLYANAINDGIVPLYTASLLYLDWKGLNEDNGGVTNDKTSGGMASNLFTNPFQKALSLLAPNAQASESKEEVENRGNIFPKTSMIESAASIVLPPLPPMKFITTPASRPNVIVHDRMYTEDDIPPKVIRKKNFLQNLDPMAKFHDLEDDIAREWHRGLSWRKVLVKLEPDAHNNIIVRRKYANAFGWQVVEHMVNNHFTQSTPNAHTVPKVDSSADLESLEEIRSLVDRDTLQRDNEELDLGDDAAPTALDMSWVNQKDGESIFDLGPTGMMTNFNDMLNNFRNWSVPETTLTQTITQTIPRIENAEDIVEERDADPDAAYIESTTHV
ncbi:ROG1 [Cyberlindnera jadinii]|uniref:ROG1 protein n=1 Tax=Cyberlindnera jadinii (strain ATCC 18201 / CBS 1600 / BCRC 20928 / JCM 3617 / NBRC 0987 / NRRL Y-1542) TaxID=983966 RepID=A0A0H5C7G6_CYBJN|nr:ROG1 [Cyberlindnera jadinii]